MAQKLLKLVETGEISKLQESLQMLAEGELEELLTQTALSTSPNLPAILRAIFLGSPCQQEEGVTRRRKVYEHCFSLAESGDMQRQNVTEMVGLLMLEADVLPGECLAELATAFVAIIKAGGISNGLSMELFPCLLTCLASKETISYGKGCQSGASMKNQIIRNLCSCRWELSSIIHLASMFRDVLLSAEELQLVVGKILKTFPVIYLQDIPPLVYQLLLLSAKGQKHEVLDGIISFFSRLDQRCKENQNSHTKEPNHAELVDPSLSWQKLRQVEGTVILHVAFAIGLDQGLGREFIKGLRSRQVGEVGKVLCPFQIALAMSVARIQRFEEQIYEFMKITIVKSLKDSQMQRSSSLIRELIPEECHISEVIVETVQNSTLGWDHVTQGLFHLGFVLLDSFGQKSGPGRRVSEATVGPFKTINQLACALGAKILLETFKVHEPMRSEILEQLLNRVVTKASSPIRQYLALLSDTVMSAPLILYECLPKVQEVFDYLCYLPPSAVLGLLKAIQPLLKVNVGLKDSLMLVLRKSMFARELEARKSSATGFLLLLKNFKVQGSVPCSQPASQIITDTQLQGAMHAKLNPAANEALCLEILSSLRRCLAQQADVRLLLYEGLYDVLKKNSQLASPILQMLLQQLRRHFETRQDILPPLRLEGCITRQGEQVFLQEPLAHLLSCVQACVRKWKEVQRQAQGEGWFEDGDGEDDTGEGDNVLLELQELLDSISVRMLKSELEDFELDKSADFSLSNSIGVKNNIYAVLVLGAYEVLLEYNFTGPDISIQQSEQVLGLFKRYQQLAELLKEKVAKGKNAAKSPRSLLSLTCIGSLLKALLSEINDEVGPGLVQLQGYAALQRHVVITALHKLQQAEETGQVDGPDGQNVAKLFTFICSAARTMLWHYTSVPASTQSTARKDKSRPLNLLCLEGLKRAFGAVQHRFSEKLPQFFTAIDLSREALNDVADVCVTERAAFHIRQFQRSVVAHLSSREDDGNPREMIVLVELVAALTQLLEPGTTELAQALNWTTKICKESNAEEVPFCRALLGLLFSLHGTAQGLCVVLQNLSQDAHSQLGDIDEDVEIEDQLQYAIVNIKTAPSVTLLLVGQMEQLLAETDWLASRLKRHLQSSKESTIDETAKEKDDEFRAALEKAVILQAGYLITACHELIQSALPPGSCIDSLLKLIGRLYSTLTGLVKHYLQVYALSAGHLPARFEKLVRLSGSHLTPQCYAFITYLQSVQSEQLRQAGAEKKKGNRGQSSTASAAKAKVLRETKPIPNLIFSIEQYERFLIQLSKKAKVNLMQYMKLSTSRDFRINAASLQEPQPQQEEGTQDDEEGKGVCERTSSQTSDTQRAGTSTSGVGRAGTQQTSMKPKVAVVQRGGQAPPKKRRKI
uniref:Fanconi anemia group I protein n=1 Tax=Myxine glutinosa TaxID=7769 RepID=UPI00358E4A64